MTKYSTQTPQGLFTRNSKNDGYTHIVVTVRVREDGTDYAEANYCGSLAKAQTKKGSIDKLWSESGMLGWNNLKSVTTYLYPVAKI